MRNPLTYLLPLLMLLLFPAVMRGTETGRTDSADSVATTLSVPQVSLLTASPGPIIYELDGHTALRFRYPDGRDFVINWGVFDFSAPNFLYRFVKGETDYMAWPFDYSSFIAAYSGAGRTVTEQTLNLTPAQAITLEQLVSENLKPANRTYRYNYIYDNCATRPFLLIEKSIGSEIHLDNPEGFVYGETGIADDPATPHTFRREMALSHADYPWYQFGIDLALGSGLDREISPRERAYYPLFLRDALRNAYYISPADGSRIPLLSGETSTAPAGRVTEPATPFLLSPMAVMLLVMILVAAVALHDIRRRSLTRWVDSAIYSVFFICSLLLTFLIFVSVHEATSPNWLYLWLNPLTVIPAALIWIKRCGYAVYCYQICNFVALLLLTVIGIVGIQRLNAAFYPLIIADIILSARYLYIYKTVLSTHRTVAK